MNSKIQYFKIKRGTFMFLSFLTTLFVSCNNSNNNKVIDFELEKRIALPMPKEVINSQGYLITYPYSVKLIENEQKLLVNFYSFNYLFVYDLNTKEIVNKIPFSNTYDFHDVVYINHDSILLFLSGVYKYYYDTSIVVINSKGEIKKSYGIEYQQIVSSSTFNLNQLDEHTNLNCLFPMYKIKNFCYNNRAYFVLNITQKKFLENNFVPILGFYDFNKNKTYIYQNVTYPLNKPISVFNYPENILKLSGNIISSKDELWLSFAFSPTVYKHDLKTDKGNFVVLNSKLVDTTWVYNEEKTENLYMYSNVTFIKSFRKYVRMITLLVNEERFHSWVTYDEQFNYLGEVIKKIPIGINNENFYYSDIVNDSLVINFYKPKEISFDARKFEEELKQIPKPKSKNESCNFIQNNSNSSNNILDFFNNKNLKSDSLFSVMVLNENGCTSCNEYFINFLKLNSFLLNMKKNPFYCVYITNDKKGAENFFQKNKLDNIIVEESKNYNTYHPFMYFNPRLILIKNQKIVSDTIYMPDQLENLVERLLNFYGFTTE